MAQLAAALREPSLDDAAFAAAEALIADVKRPDCPKRSPLYSVANVQRLNAAAHGLMMRNVGRGLVLARLSVFIAPRVACRTRAAAARIQRLTAEAHYLCASAHLRCRHCHEAQIAAERALRTYRAAETAPDDRKQLTLAELAYGQILFYRGSTERGLRIVSRAARTLLDTCHDRRLHAIATTWYGFLLHRQRKYRLALRAFDEAMFYATEIDDKIVITSILHNFSLTAAELGLSGALPGRNISRERLEQFELDSERPKSRYITYAVLKREGKYNAAISELYMIRHEFLDRGLPVLAAQSVVEIVEQLLRLGRHSEARAVGDDALETLTNAGVEFDAAMLRALLAKCKVRRER